MHSPNSKKQMYRRRRIFVAVVTLLLLIALVCIVVGIISILNRRDIPAEPAQTPLASQTPNIGALATPDVPAETTAPESIAPTERPKVNYPPALACASAQKSAYGFITELMVNGAPASSYTASKPIEFLHNDEYCRLDGVLTFRGSCFRQNPFFGTAEITQGKLSLLHNIPTASLGKGAGGSYKGSWTGSGWTGQPLIVKWDEETKQIMNLYPSAKQKEGLVEVIYATMDGNIYFFDLETGEATRDKLKLGVPFKGAGSLDPRGYPLMYLGQGDHYAEAGRGAKAIVVSLIEGKVLYSFGQKDDPFALRSWHAYDSAPILDEGTDTLIYPGENGIIYRVVLNTNYDKANGTISVNPDTPVKVRYKSNRTTNDGYWLGYESSAVAWRNYIYVADNAGFLQCIDANTMETVWVQDIWDDTNATPALEEDPENNTAYLYVGCSLDNKAVNGKGNVAFFKIDAITGEIIWQVERNVYTSDITGGVMSSAVIGKGKISDLVITTFASYGAANSGEMVAINKDTKEIVWSKQLSGYAWSSPVAMYDADGNAYVIQCNSAGDICVFDGATGNLLDKVNVESNIEASPAAYGNYIVIGTRVKGIHIIRID